MKNVTTIIILIFSLNIAVGQKPKFKKVTKEELQKEVSSIDSMAKAEFLFKGCEVSFEFNKRSGSFDVLYRHHQRIKIYKSDNNSMANFLVQYYQGEKNSDSEKITDLEAYTFNLENGKVIKEKLSKGNIYDEEKNKFYNLKKFAFPAISDGSVLEVKYTLRSQYYFNIDEFYFQSDIPVKYAEYTIGTPEYFNYNVNTKGLVQVDVSKERKQDNFMYSYIEKNRGNNSVMRGTVSTKQVRKTERIDYAKEVTTYKVTNVPAIKNESYVYTMDNYKSSIRHELLYTKYPRAIIKYYTKTWNDIAKLLDENNSFGGQLNSNYKQFNDLIDSVNDMESNQKIQTIYQSVQDQFTWNEYLGHYTDDGIKSMIESGKGNVVEINLLLVNLLRKAGLNAHPMVSRESSTGFLNFSNPSISQLNYVTAVIENEGNYIYLDASDKKLMINTLPKRALNIKGIIINEETGVETELMNPNKGKENRIYSLSIDGESLSGIYKQTIKGYAAYVTRNLYGVESDFISSLDTETKTFTNCIVENYDSRSGIKVTSDIKADGLVQYIDDKIFVDLEICDENFTNPFKQESRDFALFFDNTYSNVDMIKIKIPEGYTVESIPKKLNIATPDKLITVMINFSEVNGEIAMTKKSTLSETIISPKYYQAVKMIYNQVESKMKEKIVFAKK
ncbi:MAG: transglutaminase-like putative cysteine protease [Saprospiraceae bacterium]|jgi:transglutaminase-like putative cysteine protease